MWRFSQKSEEKLLTADIRLAECFFAALEASPVDFGISCGHRDEVAQLIAFQEGKSTKSWPESKHNQSPSLAVDFYPYIAGQGAVWTDLKLFFLIAGLVLGIGHARGFDLRWGGAWNGTLNGPKQFNDLPHIEIVERR